MKFQPGTSGNPNGRPRSHDLQRAIRRHAEPQIDAIAQRVVAQAVQGDADALDMVRRALERS